MSMNLESLARDQLDAAAARDVIGKALGAEDGHRQVYAALCRWTWRVTIERRLDDDLRGWHRLLLDTASRIARGKAAGGQPASRLGLTEAAERLRAFAEILGLSIEAADASEEADLAGRTHVQAILRLLAAQGGRFVDRQQISDALGLGAANLSRVLTLLVVNGLIERQPRGRTAAFRILKRGMRLLPAEGPIVSYEPEPVPAGIEPVRHFFPVVVRAKPGFDPVAARHRADDRPADSVGFSLANRRYSFVNRITTPKSATGTPRTPESAIAAGQ